MTVHDFTEMLNFVLYSEYNTLTALQLPKDILHM